jgi:hypothetical protein
MAERLSLRAELPLNLAIHFFTRSSTDCGDSIFKDFSGLEPASRNGTRKHKSDTLGLRG